MVEVEEDGEGDGRVQAEVCGGKDADKRRRFALGL
jgi:hypothetical protein